MAINIPGLDTFAKRVCNTIDAETGKRPDCYIAIKAGNTVQAAKQIDRIDDIGEVDSEDLAQQITDIVEGSQRDYKVFVVALYERPNTNPSYYMRPNYYSKQYEAPQQAGLSPYDDAPEKAKPSGAAEMALARITISSHDIMVDANRKNAELWETVAALNMELGKKEVEIGIYKMLAGVQKWQEARAMVRDALEHASPIIRENAGKALDLASTIVKLKLKEREEQAKKENPTAEIPPSERLEKLLAEFATVASEHNDALETVFPQFLELIGKLAKASPMAAALMQQVISTNTVSAG